MPIISVSGSSVSLLIKARRIPLPPGFFLFSASSGCPYGLARSAAAPHTSLKSPFILRECLIVSMLLSREFRTGNAGASRIAPSPLNRASPEVREQKGKVFFSVHKTGFARGPFCPTRGLNRCHAFRVIARAGTTHLRPEGIKPKIRAHYFSARKRGASDGIPAGQHNTACPSCS